MRFKLLLGVSFLAFSTMATAQEAADDEAIARRDGCFPPSDLSAAGPAR